MPVLSLLSVALAGPVAAQSLGAVGGPGASPLAWQACAQLPPGGDDEAEPLGSPAGDLLVGQVASVQGRAWLYDREQQAWLSPGSDAAWANWPLTQGDRLRTEPGARLTLRIASATVRMDGDSTLHLKRLAPDLVWVQLHTGQAAWHVPGDARARTLVLQADTVCARPLRAGHYGLQLGGAGEGADRAGSDRAWAPVDRPAQAAERPWLVATTWRGELALQAPETELRLPAGRQAAWLRPPPGARPQLQASQSSPFAEWALAQARQDLPPPDSAELPETLSGAQTLAAHGQWRDDPEWGRLWVPTQTEPGWAPYRDGRWTWRPSWGWTWVDAAPWGFVTVYYGRWVPWRSGWAWVPGHQHGGVYRPPYPVQPGHPGHPVVRPPPVFQPVPPGLTPPPQRPRPLPLPVQPGRPWLQPPGTAPGHDRYEPPRGDRWGRPAPAVPAPSGPWPGRGDRPDRPDRPERGDRGDAPDKPLPRVPGWSGAPHSPSLGLPAPGVPADRGVDPPVDRSVDRPVTRPVERFERANRPEAAGPVQPALPLPLPAPRQEPRLDTPPEPRGVPRPDLRTDPRPELRPDQRPAPTDERGTPWGRGRPGMDGGRPAWSHGGAPAQPAAAPQPMPMPVPAAALPAPQPMPAPQPRAERPVPPPAAARPAEPARADEARERDRERQRPAGPSAQQAR